MVNKFQGIIRAKGAKAVRQPSKTPSSNETHPMGKKRATIGMTKKADMKLGTKGN